MCEFCTQHGEGKKWYLQMKNYSQDMMSQKWRKLFSSGSGSLDDWGKAVAISLNKFERLKKLPRFLQNIIKGFVVRSQKKDHFGQVIPMSDVRQIIPMMNSIVRLPCVCRKATLGAEKRYCFGIGVYPEDELKNQPELPNNFELMTGDEALKSMEEFDKKGMIHTIWTFGTPFIGGLCNCDRDCGAYRARVWNGTNLFFKGEYIAEVDPDKCTGCKNCQKQCQFGAVSFSLGSQKCGIEKQICYGCGVCKTACPKGAITLIERIKIPAVAKEW